MPENDSDIGRLAVTVNAAIDAQQRAEGAVTGFVADASRELRTLLTTAGGWVELYLQGGLAEVRSVATRCSGSRPNWAECACWSTTWPCSRDWIAAEEWRPPST